LYGENLLIYDPLNQYTTFPDKCRYIPASDSLAEFEAVCTSLCARKQVVFVVEECERYIGQGKPMGPNAFDLINRGRNWGIYIVAVTRRIQRLSKDFFDLCQGVVFFKCGLQSRRYIEEMVGKEHLQHINSLEKYQFLFYQVEEPEEIKMGRLKLSGVREHIEEQTTTLAKEEEED